MHDDAHRQWEQQQHRRTSHFVLDARPYTLYSTLYTVSSPPSTLHPPRSTLHPPPSTLHPPPSARHQRKAFHKLDKSKRRRSFLTHLDPDFEMVEKRALAEAAAEENVKKTKVRKNTLRATFPVPGT